MAPGRYVLYESIHLAETKFLVRHFASAEAKAHFHLHVLAEEIDGMPELHAEIMRINIRAELDFLNLVRVLVFLAFLILFGLLVTELAEVNEPANRWRSSGGDLNQIHASLARESERLVEGHYPELFRFIPNKPNFAGPNLIVYPNEVSLRKLPGRKRAAQDTLSS